MALALSAGIAFAIARQSLGLVPGLAVAVAVALVAFAPEFALPFVLFAVPVLPSHVMFASGEPVLWAFFSAIAIRYGVIQGKWNGNKASIPLLAFFVLLLISTLIREPAVFSLAPMRPIATFPISPDVEVLPRYALAFRQVVTFAESVLLFWWAASRPQDEERVWIAVVLSVVAVLLLTTREYLQLSRVYGDGTSLRLGGPFYENPNILGNYLALALPLLFAKVKRWTVLPIALLGGGVWAMILAGSTGAGLALGLAAVLALAGRFWVKRGTGWVVPGIVGSFGVAFLVLAASMKIWGVDPVALLTGERAYLWLAALRMSLAHPLLGVGLERYFHSFATYAPPSYADHPVIHAHNVFLHLMAEAGIPVMMALIWALHRAFKSIRLTEGNRGYRFGMLLGVISCLIHNLGDYGLMNAPISIIFWGMLGTLVGASRAEGDSAKT